MSQALGIDARYITVSFSIDEFDNVQVVYFIQYPNQHPSVSGARFIYSLEHYLGFDQELALLLGLGGPSQSPTMFPTIFCPVIIANHYMVISHELFLSKFIFEGVESAPQGQITQNKFKFMHFFPQNSIFIITTHKNDTFRLNVS